MEKEGAFELFFQQPDCLSVGVKDGVRYLNVGIVCIVP